MSRLGELLPGLVACASGGGGGGGGGGGFNAATRCEAFGALRAAAATHTSAVASMWGSSWGLDAILPATTCASPPSSSASSGGGDGSGGGGEGGGDRVALASARFLAEYLLALGGGGTASTGSDDDPTSTVGPTTTTTTSAAAAAVAGSSAVTPAALISLWTDVAGAHFPAMTSHASPLVRAGGLSALTGLTGAVLTGVSEPDRRALVDTPHRLLREEAVPAVRAAACRAIGALAALPPLADPPPPPSSSSEEPGAAAVVAPREALEPSVDILLRALKDNSKSVRLPASWAVANLCNTVAASAVGRDKKSKRLRFVPPVAAAAAAAAADTRAEPPIVSMATLAQLAKACVTAATQEGDKAGVYSLHSSLRISHC